MALPQRYSGRRIDLQNTRAPFVDYAEEIDQVVNYAVRQALLEHKRAGNPVADWKDGRVVMVQPENILVDDPHSRAAA